MSAIEVRFGKSSHPDAKTAVQELVAQTGDIGSDLLLFFCSPKYDLSALGKAVKADFACPAFGCTTAGEILGSEGYLQDSVVCAAIASNRLSAQLILIKDLKRFVEESEPPKNFPVVDRKNSFAILLVDGLSMLEEAVVARLTKILKGVPLIGASAADGLAFERTHVYHNGAFHENAATLAIFETSLPFQTLHIQHFEPTDKRLVVTAADLPTRTVTEINGQPAAGEYARILGVEVSDLSPEVFAAHPLMVRIGGIYHVRSIQKVNPDGSLTFYCMIDVGIVLVVARLSERIPENLESNLEEIGKTMKPALIFGSDCILRRLEIKRHGEMEAVERVLSRYPFIGFSTYGEQIFGMHVNCTLTALALGDEP